MAETARTLFQKVLEAMKVYSPGVSVNAADLTTMQGILNDMLDSWSNDRLACYANLEQSFAMVPNKQTYTIGTSGGADINQARPLEVLVGPGRCYQVDSQGNHFPMNVVQQDVWNQIGLPSEVSDLPDTFFYDPQFPLGIIKIFPVPLVANTVYFDSRLPLADLPTLATAFSLPPGYIQAIKDGLFIAAWRYWKSGDPKPSDFEAASKSLAAIKRTNIKRTPSPYDSAIVSKAQGAYNIYTDNTNRGNG